MSMMPCSKLRITVALEVEYIGLNPVNVINNGYLVNSMSGVATAVMTLSLDDTKALYEQLHKIIKKNRGAE
jgi:hypothetical protein